MIGHPVRVALYARVSTRDKDQDPELQLEPLRAYVAARGWEAVKYVDQAPAGDLARRTAWRRLLDDVQRRRVDRVLVWKLDRAFRSTLDALRTLEVLDHAGAGFASLVGQWLPNQPDQAATSLPVQSDALPDQSAVQSDALPVQSAVQSDQSAVQWAALPDQPDQAATSLPDQRAALPVQWAALPVQWAQWLPNLAGPARPGGHQLAGPVGRLAGPCPPLMIQPGPLPRALPSQSTSSRTSRPPARVATACDGHEGPGHSDSPVAGTLEVSRGPGRPFRKGSPTVAGHSCSGTPALGPSRKEVLCDHDSPHGRGAGDLELSAHGGDVAYRCRTRTAERRAGDCPGVRAKERDVDKMQGPDKDKLQQPDITKRGDQMRCRCRQCSGCPRTADRRGEACTGCQDGRHGGRTSR